MVSGGKSSSGAGRPGPGVSEDVEDSVLDCVVWEEPELGEDNGGEDGVSHGGGGGRGGAGRGSEEEHQGQAQESGDCLQTRRLDIK